MIERYGGWVLRWRHVLIIAALIVTAAAGLGALSLQFTTDYRAFFSPANPQLLAFERLQDTYTKSDNVLIVLAPEDGEVFSRETLGAVVYATEQAWQTPHSIRVDSLSNFQHTRADGDELLVEDLVADPQQLDDAELKELRATALAEPALLRRLISDRGHVTAINVTIQLPGDAPQIEVPQVVEFSRALVADLQQRYPDIDVYLSGQVLMNASFQEAAITDMTSLVPVMSLVILVMLGLLLRGFSGTFASLLLLLFSILGAMGLAGWAGIKLTGPSAIAPIVIMTLGVADSIHFLTTMLYEMRRNGLDKSAAIVESLRQNFSPILLTSLTTAIGFLTLNFGEVPPFADFGNIVAVGVVLAFVWSVVLLPAIMMALPVKARLGATPGARLMDRFGDFVVRRRRPLLWGMLALMATLIALIPRNELNDEYVKYFDESFEFRRATDFITENLTGLYDIHYSLSAGEAGGINDPAYLAKIEQFAEWYRRQPEVLHVNVITDTFKRLNKNLHGGRADEYRLPQERELAAQYLLLFEMSLPFGLDLNNQINVDKSATRFSVTLTNLSTNELLALEQRAQQWLREHGLPAMRAKGSSSAIMFAHINYRNIRAMLVSAGAALLLISLLLAFALRSLKYGLISIVPNLLPVAVAFGLWGLLRAEIGLGLSVVAGVTIGIVVDDTIHFMSKYLRARRERVLGAEEAVLYAFRNVGVALLTMTVVLVAGFLVLAQSPFRVNADLGLMTAITIVIALIVDFLFLPPLLMRLEEDHLQAVNLREQTA